MKIHDNLQNCPKDIRDLCCKLVETVAFNLNDTQTKILCDLIEGQTVKQIANKYHRKEDAVREYALKSLKIVKITLPSDIKKKIESLKDENSRIKETAKKEIKKLNASLNEIKNKSISERNQIIINDIKNKYLELKTQNDILKGENDDLKKQVSYLKSINPLYDESGKARDIFSPQISENVKLGEFLETELRDLAFSKRTLNALRSLGLHTLGDVVCRSKAYIASCQGIGKTALKEIDDKLEMLDLHYEYGNEYTVALRYYRIYKRNEKDFKSQYHIIDKG